MTITALPPLPITIEGFAPLEEGEHRIIRAAGHSWLVARIDGELRAVEDLCGHQPRPLAGGELSGSCFNCPHHGVIWDLNTGEAVDPRGFDSIEPLTPLKCTLEGTVLRLGGS